MARASYSTAAHALTLASAVAASQTLAATAAATTSAAVAPAPATSGSASPSTTQQSATAATVHTLCGHDHLGGGFERALRTLRLRRLHLGTRPHARRRRTACARLRRLGAAREAVGA